ncbi:MAG: peptidyl-prolyl cis-trans isomerase [Puniceicoccales bacterium]|jgi:peptidyl-prolyl cis-trans isomerase SurA|nr:peptidyl-prolyl cis-trans isomerase [Puniceicoccales bacterium]
MKTSVNAARSALRFAGTALLALAPVLVAPVVSGGASEQAAPSLSPTPPPAPVVPATTPAAALPASSSAAPASPSAPSAPSVPSASAGSSSSYIPSSLAAPQPEAPGPVPVPKAELPASLTPKGGPTASPARFNRDKPEASDITPEQYRRAEWEETHRNQPRVNADGAIITQFDVNKGVSQFYPSILREAQGNLAVINARVNRMSAEQAQLMADRKLVVREFYAKGGAITPSMVTSQIEQRIQTVHGGSRDEYFDNLRRRGITPMEDRRLVEEDMIFGFMQGEAVKGIEEASPKKIADFYEQNKARLFTAPEQFRYRVILLAPGAAESNADVAAQKRFVAEELAKGVPFQRLVPQFLNKDAGRFEDGGAAQWRNAADMGEQMLVALRGVKDGEVAPPVELTGPDGRLNVYFFQRVERRAGGAIPLEEVRDNIAFELLKREREVAIETLLERLRNKYFVRFY